MFLQLIDEQGLVCWETEEATRPASTTWKPGKVTTGPYPVRLPPSATGTFDILAGLVSPRAGPNWWGRTMGSVVTFWGN